MINAKSNSMNKISSGYRINTAADSPSDILRISKFEAQMRGSKAAQQNIQGGISLLQTMDKTLETVTNIGQKLRDLAIKYNSGTLSNEEKQSAITQGKDLFDEMKEILNNTKFGNINVFKTSSYNIQTGPNGNDTLQIKIPNIFGSTKITTQETVIESKTYGIQASTPYGIPVNGNITLDLSKNTATSSFTIQDGIKNHSGILTFTDNKTARFEINWCGSKITGTLNLNNISDKTQLDGVNSYTIDKICGRKPYNVTFTLKSQQNKVINTEKDVSIQELDFSKNADLIFNTDFIDKNIINPVSQARSYIGSKQNILEQRLSYQINNEELQESSLSKIRDVDVAKETLEMAKQELLISANIQLLSNFRDSQRQYILSLLS